MTPISIRSISSCSILKSKSGDPAAFHRLTGVDWAPTLRLAERLAAISKPVWVRHVLVPGLTDDSAHISAVARFVAAMRNVERVEVLPFTAPRHSPANWSLDAFDEECGGVLSNDA